jgi:nitroreductase
MSIIEQIEKRKSVRSYTGEPLNKEHIDAITNYVAELKAPFGAKVHIHLIHSNTGVQPVKLGTYGYIKGASDFLALVYEKAPLAEESAAYMFEQVVLFCTGLDLGTCWLGGSFNRKDFRGQLSLQPNEKLRIVSPVGYPSDKKRWIESLIGTSRNHKSRKPFGSLFFHRDFTAPLSEEAAGLYRQPLEMVRLAPSANNAQPWRILFNDNVFHFYHSPSLGGFSATDMGIALCHFEQTCRELNIKGQFEVLNTPEIISAAKNCNYSVSWKTGE